jgi:hypothetical protein
MAAKEKTLSFLRVSSDLQRECYMLSFSVVMMVAAAMTTDIAMIATPNNTFIMVCFIVNMICSFC